MAQRRALPQSQTRPAQPQAKEGALLLPSSSSPSSLLRLISPFPSHHTCSSHLTPSHIFSPFKNRTVYPVSFFFSFSCHFLFHRTFLFFPPLVSSRLFYFLPVSSRRFFASLLVSYLISLLISLLIPRYFFIFFCLFLLSLFPPFYRLPFLSSFLSSPFYFLGYSLPLVSCLLISSLFLFPCPSHIFHFLFFFL